MAHNVPLRPLWIVPAIAIAVVACSSPKTPGRTGETGVFQPDQLFKSDVDRFSEAHYRALMASLKVLAEKLYRRNPHEWHKGHWNQVDDPLNRLFASRHNWAFPELEGHTGVEAMRLALRPDYAGDRVFALVAGMGGMLLAAFGGRDEQDMSDDLDPQKLYNAARNLEIVVWKLSNSKGPDGHLLLLTNEGGGVPNLSFEREFGKMIGNLDLLSTVVADKANRTVIKILQNMATAVFLPVAIK